MGTIKDLVTAVALLMTINGCTVIMGPEPYIEGHYSETDCYYVDSYISIHYEVRRVIADYTVGYSMPPIDRYGPEIYPFESFYNSENLPSYVCADFNGDGWKDYACMFSKIHWSGGSWYLKTKLLVVISTYHGFKLCAEYVLGTVKGSANTPVKEYWGIRLLERGTHILRVSKSGRIEETRVELANDGIYLGSVEPEERSILYVTGTELNEYYLDLGAVPKRRALTAQDRENLLIDLTNWDFASPSDQADGSKK